MIRNNFQVEAARTARFTLHPLLSILLFIVLFIFTQFISGPVSYFGALLAQNLPSPYQAPLFFAGVYLIIPFGISMAIFIGFTRFVEKRPVSSLGFSSDRFVKKYLKGFLFGVLMLLMYWAIALLTGTLKWEEMTFQFNQVQIWTGVLLVLPGWIIQGASEEVLTRGWLYQSVSAKYGGLLGLIVAPSLFAFLHLFNSHINLLPLFNLLLFGIFAVFYMLYDRSLWGICALHSSWNWAQGNIFGIAVSGNPTVGGSLVVSGPTFGPEFMTGAGFGAEGSIIVTGILLSGIGLLIFLLQKEKTSSEVF